jgi:hypothetical protein
MHINTDKIQQNKSNAIADNLSKLQSNNETALQFTDDRPKSIEHRKLQEAANNSPQVKQLRAYQVMANNSPRVKQLRAYQEITTTTPAQQLRSPKVIQAKLQSAFENKKTNEEIDGIQQEIDKYNKLEEGSKSFIERKAVLQQLSLVETMIFQWFNNHMKVDLDVETTAVNMKFLMNGAQTERINLVARSVNEKDEEPPVAGFDSLHPTTQQRVTLIWKKLLAGSGIKITGDKNFEIKVLADFSRLLQLQMGRRLIAGIMITDKGLVITPTTMAAGKFVARPNDAEKESLYKIDPEKVDTSLFLDLDYRKKNQAQRLDILQDLRVKDPTSTGVKITSEKGIEYFAFNEGTGSTLPVPVDAKDAMQHNSSRMSDEKGNEIIAPTFINLGHELGHVLRSAQGMSASNEGDKLISHGFPDVEQPDRPEEFFNIEGVENPLRLEAGILPRHGHGNVYSHWAVKTMNSIEKMEKNIDGISSKITGKDAEILKKIKTGISDVLRPQVLDLMGGKGSITGVLDLFQAIQKDVNGLLVKFL